MANENIINVVGVNYTVKTNESKTYLKLNLILEITQFSYTIMDLMVLVKSIPL